MKPQTVYRHDVTVVATAVAAADDVIDHQHPGTARDRAASGIVLRMRGGAVSTSVVDDVFPFPVSSRHDERRRDNGNEQQRRRNHGDDDRQPEAA